MEIKKLFYRNTIFFCLYLLLFVPVACINMFVTKKDSFLFINNAHNPFFDLIFSLFTFMGDGFFIIMLSLLLFILKYKRLALGVVSSYLISGLVVQIIKRIINLPRPAGFLPDPSAIHKVYQMSLHHQNSFPSGHTTSAFAAAVFISLYTRNRSLGVILFIIATIVGYSRIYLGQHFVEDVLAGSFLGVVIGTLCFWAHEKFLEKKYEKHMFTNHKRLSQQAGH